MYPSLQQRIIRGMWSTPTPEPAPTCNTTSTYTIGRGTYLKYDKTKLEQAVLAAEQGESYRRAAEMYGVPRSTLHVRKIQPDSKCGPKPYLQKFQPMDVMKKSYHPLYSPTKPPQVVSEDSSSDSEYDDKNLDHCIVPFPQGKSIGKLFSKFTIPIHPSQLSEKPKCSGQALKSIENQKILAEKEKKRHDELLKKEERKRKRERKAFGSVKKKVKSLGMCLLYIVFQSCKLLDLSSCDVFILQTPVSANTSQGLHKCIICK